MRAQEIPGGVGRMENCVIFHSILLEECIINQSRYTMSRNAQPMIIPCIGKPRKNTMRVNWCPVLLVQVFSKVTQCVPPNLWNGGGRGFLLTRNCNLVSFTFKVGIQVGLQNI